LDPTKISCYAVFPGAHEPAAADVLLLVKLIPSSWSRGWTGR